jgi:opacity protein-like surface antigen
MYSAVSKRFKFWLTDDKSGRRSTQGKIHPVRVLAILLHQRSERVLPCRKRTLGFCVDTAYLSGEDGSSVNRTLGCEEGHPKMRRVLLLCGAILCLSVTAAAQDAAVSFDANGSATESAAPISFQFEGRTPWQLGAGYQYQHLKPLGQTFHTNGYNVNITRFLNDWVGVEGTAIMGFGSSSTGIHTKSLFIGGGPHAAINEHGRFEPWVHGLIGLEHVRTAVADSGLGFIGGGGVDFKIGPRLYWRVQGDFIGTRFNGFMQSGYSFGTGVILNF